MSEAGKKLSEVATQKSSEVYGTVSDKVRKIKFQLNAIFFVLSIFTLFSYFMFCSCFSFYLFICYWYKVKEGELLKGISDQASSVAGLVSDFELFVL